MTASPAPLDTDEAPSVPSEAPAVPKTLDEAIREAAAEPKSVTVDGQTVQARDLRELLAAERHLAAKKAARRAGGGLRVTTLRHSGAN